MLASLKELAILTDLLGSELCDVIFRTIEISTCFLG